MSTIAGKNRNIQNLRGLSTNRSLLSSVPDGTEVNLFSTDDDSGRQKWDMTLVDGFNDVYNIKVSRGNSTPRVFLSCAKDGSYVDLFGSDDGSGRQRWQFVPISSNIPSFFQIKVVGGVDGGRVYLSCVPDGTQVNLWNIDDRSGHQQWQLQ